MTGSTVGAALGATIGFFVGGPAGARWGYFAGSIIGGYLDPAQIEGPRLTDAQTQLSNEGVPRPIIYGTACVAGNIIQVGPLVEHKKTQRAGKGGPEQTTYTYTRTVAIRICEAAPNGGTMRLVRVWKDDKLVADWSPANTIPAETAAFESLLTFYSGAEDQLPDPSLEALPTENGGGVGNVPAYRGTCYAVLTDLDVTERGGAVPQFRWEVSSDATEESAIFEWTHSNTGRAQSNFARDISDTGTCIVAGWNDNLRRSVGGETWEGIDYGSQLGWNPFFSGNAIRNLWWAGGATWYLAKFNQVAKSSDDGRTWSIHNSTLYDLVDGSVGLVNGVAYAGAQTQPSGHGSNTCIFQPLVTTDTVIDLGIAAGKARCIAECNGVRYVGTTDGSIIRGTTKVDDQAQNVSQFASVGDTILAARPTSGYSYSTDNGLTWAFSSSLAMRGVCAFDGAFFAVTQQALLRSETGLPGSWVVVDTLFAGNGNDTDIVSSDGGLFAVNQDGSRVAAFVPAAGGIAIPDVPKYWAQIDGTVTGYGALSVTASSVALGEIITDLCGRAGIAADQIDVSALAGITVRGFPVARQTSAAEAIRALQQVFLFDFPEWGDGGEVQTKLRAVLRGGATVLALTDDDLVDTDEDDETRGQQVEFPRKLSVTASDPEANYEPVTEAAERESENVKAVGEQQVSTAVVLTRDEIKQLADKLLKVLWEQATGRKKVEVPEEFSIYTPSDRLTYGGKTYRIDRVELLDGSSKWDLTRDRAGAYTSSATGGTPLTPTPPVSSIRGPTMFAAMNLPRLRSQDTTPGMYVAVAGLLPGWAGCDLYLSTDDGVTEQLVATIQDASTMGTLSADLAEDGTTLSVSLYDGELDSATVDQLLARHNAAAVTTDGVSEILQFQTATETGTDAYDLTDLSRGVLGTAEDDHVAGDSFVALDALTFLPLDIALAGKTLIFRPVSRGTVPANNATYSVQFKPQFTGPQVVEAYTDDAGNVYTDDDGNTYYYEVPPT